MNIIETYVGDEAIKEWREGEEYMEEKYGTLAYGSYFPMPKGAEHWTKIKTEIVNE